MSDMELLRMIDKMIINASPEELKKIQKLDRQEQLNGISFCDVWTNHRGRRRSVATRANQQNWR